MKTLEEVLDGVTDGGKWKFNGADKSPRNFVGLSYRDAAYVARACSTWPELVKALEGLTKFSRELCEDTGISANYPSIQAARSALEAAFKD